ncbi:MAG: hypothetical protein JXQ72_16025, partial [Anaerolineae bacterium]|nr:hypothetical protein [Anaerolineae bacterium]
MAHTIFVRGIENWPDINIRNKPGTQNTTVIFRVPKDWRAECSKVTLDPQGANFEGQTYQWFHLTFEDGQMGWARDDLLDLIGDCTAFGYGFYAVRTYAFTASKEIAADGVPPTRSKPVFEEDEEVCSAQVRDDIGEANVRAEPLVSSTWMGAVKAGASISVLDVVPGQGNDPFRWIKVRSGEIHGYIREDLLVYSDGCAELDLSTDDSDSLPSRTHDTDDDVSLPNPDYRFDSPVKGNYIVFQEFHSDHNGADLAGNAGIGVYAGGDGRVAYTVACKKCTDSKPNFKSHGIDLWDENAINDPDWGYGYGNYVVVCYAWKDLPKAARDKLTAMGNEGFYVYVIYAHLKNMDVTKGTVVNKNTRLG